MKIHPVAATLGLMLLVSTSEAASAQPANVCLQPTMLRSAHPLDDRTVIITDVAHHKFKVSLMGICPNLKWDIGVGIQSHSSSKLSCLVRGDALLVHGGGGIPGQTCPIQTIEAYTPAMEHADAAKLAMDRPQ